MDFSLTQRAYTLRLRGTNGDQSWREYLWKTHEAVNKGAKVFGDWLLTMRGGLSHKPVSMKIKTNDGDDPINSEQDPDDNLKKNRRILLALSWLSVESKNGAPEKYIVPFDIEPKTGKRIWKTVDALKEILTSRGLSDDEISQWVKDCSASLTAEIRDDAVWVNRSKAFDEINNNTITENEIWDFLGPFFSSRDAYLRPAKELSEENDKYYEDSEEKDLVQKAGQWLSRRYGRGKGADFSRMKEVYDKIASWNFTSVLNLSGQCVIESLAKEALAEFAPCSNDLDGVLKLISGPGYKSATRNHLQKISKSVAVPQSDLDKLRELAKKDARECSRKIGSKGRCDYSDTILKTVEAACGFTYHNSNGHARHSEFAVMLDHAARRVSLIHTWIKRAEALRENFEEDSKKISNVPSHVKNWLDTLCQKRSEISGAIEEYRIRKCAVNGWKEVVKAWSRADCKTKEDRIAAARALQDDPEIDKFGDIQLFEMLADDDAKCVWHKDGVPDREPDPQILLDYVTATDAEEKKRRFKVPAYRHPDPLLHPVFCDFGNSRWHIEFSIQKRAGNGEDANIHNLKMGLFDGNDITKKDLKWSSKLLVKDLALKPASDSNITSSIKVSRASRLGRVARNLEKDAPAVISGLFEQKHWNGRLQAPREQLEKIAKLEKKFPEKAAVFRQRIKWLITFSPRLLPMGPWLDYLKNFSSNNPLMPDILNKHSIKYKDNNNRKGLARLILSRLPGLRVLSVDLGHRYAAACAIWETLTAEQIKQICKQAGHREPSHNDLYLHLKTKEKNGKEKTTIYRRIAADTLNGYPHPAPWARLAKQFFIKLQGEEKAARKAGPLEIKCFRIMEKKIGHGASENNSLRVDEFMHNAVSIARLGLKRHAKRAKIAYYLTADEKKLPGGRTQKLDNRGRVELITEALEIWYSLFNGTQWTDEWAKEKWNKYIEPLLDGTVTPASLHEKNLPAPAECKNQEETLRTCLRTVAEKLVNNHIRIEELRNCWVTRWNRDDNDWRKYLRRLRDWILPKVESPSIRQVGGLSLTRIATMRLLYQTQKAYFTRLKPDGSHETANEGFGKKILNAIEKMREQRVKQLASRIVEAALGAGRVKNSGKDNSPERPYKQVDHPCHAVIIEDLTHYRPEETRTRRENLQLLNWSSGKVKKYLSESCQLHGLYLHEVAASYTSRQDSRTGAPGVRCEDVPVKDKDFIKSPFWKKEIEQAEKKRNEKKNNARDNYILELRDKLMNEKALTDNAFPVRIPLKGGSLFVSADENSPASKGIQADLNAAANIGLKALLDPDWPGRWWYVPCDSKTFRPLKDKVDGSTAIDHSKPLKIPLQEDTAEKSPNQNQKNRHLKQKAGSKEVINLWRDVSSSSISINNGPWLEYSEYQNNVQERVIRILRKQIGPGDKQ